MLSNNGTKCSVLCKLDTGAEANVMSRKVYESLRLGPLDLQYEIVWLWQQHCSLSGQCDNQLFRQAR